MSQALLSRNLERGIVDAVKSVQARDGSASHKDVADWLVVYRPFLWRAVVPESISRVTRMLVGRGVLVRVGVGRFACVW